MQWQLQELWVLLIVHLIHCGSTYDWAGINLPDGHMPFFFHNNADIADQCRKDDQCPYKVYRNNSVHLNLGNTFKDGNSYKSIVISVDSNQMEHLLSRRCWGYEENCPVDQRLSSPECPDDSRGWTNTKEEQWDNFWKGADFGYVVERKSEMTEYCAPESKDDSQLVCAKYMRYCRAKNIYLDFRRASIDGSNRFLENFLLDGEIGGHCKLNKAALKGQGEHKSALQSWFAEMEHFTSLPFKPVSSEHCDIIIDKPVMFMKLDAGVNMFHHFCDFLNFYTSQHMNNSFSQDVQLINWDTSSMLYGDLFQETFDAFTKHPIQRLKDFDDKRVCVRDAVFPLLPRMRWGMFYNMPLISGCYGSSLFQAFSAHIAHRLHLPQRGPVGEKIRITLLDRQTQYRQIMNQDKLFSALKTIGEYEVRLVVFKYKQMPYLEQAEISHNSDILIGMHGAGLTHMLFQPDWAAVIELFNCGDPNCYLDLARLRGVKYFTWEKSDKLEQQDEGHHPTLGAHQKFTNYGFDVVEFMRLVSKAADHVRSHPSFIAAKRRRDGQGPTTRKDEL